MSLKKYRLHTPLKQSVIQAFVMLALAGCGGDSTQTEQAPLQAGQFIDSPVEGLHYATPSHTGVTDSEGTFFYREDETISFSVGNIVLGHAKAQNVITPFTLSGHKPLNTEIEISRSLKSAQVNAYDRALNIASLLQSLDDDANPENGINLGTNHDRLKQFNGSLSLLAKAHTFADTDDFQALLSYLNINSARPLDEVSQHIYDSLGISVQSSQTAKRFDLNDSSDTPSQSFEYNENGDITSITVYNTETQNISKQFDLSYNDSGKLSRVEESLSSAVETRSYDNDNRLSVRTKIDESGHSSQQTFGYNASGSITQYTMEEEGAPTAAAEYIYNEDGQLSAISIDKDGDTISDRTAQLTYKNSRLNEYLEDTNSNGQADLSISYRYDANGNRATQYTRTSEASTNFSTSSFEYDANNNPIRYERDDNQDGNPEYIEAYQYNQANQRTQYKRDQNADGQWDFVAQYVYDTNGNRIRMIEDSDGNGIADKVWESGYESAVFDNTLNKIINTL